MSDQSKGKGKAPSQQSGNGENRQTSSTTGNAAQSLASALRTTMASSQLGSLMQSASGGKAEFQGNGEAGDLRDWLVQDLRDASSSGAGGSGRVTGGQTFRSGQSQSHQEGMFEDFERGLQLNEPTRLESGTEFQRPNLGSEGLNTAWNDASGRGERWQSTGLDPTTAQPIQSYTELDAPLHASVRSSLPSYAQREAAPPLSAPLASTDDVFALLDAEESQQTTTTTAPIPSTSHTTLTNDALDSSEAILSNFSPAYRPPSPSHPSFSREQANLHLHLAESQASLQGRQELLIPRPDNPSLREGVYAPTAEEALKSIFEGREESNQELEENEVRDRGEEVVRKITKWFGKTSYLEDVYGESPILRETIEVVKRRDKGDEEKREKAIRRLESLWAHLSNTPPQQSQQQQQQPGGGNWVDGWLLKNT